MKRFTMTAVQCEEDMQKARNDEKFTGEAEKREVKRMIKSAKMNGNIGDKVLLVVDPKYIHIPSWQRSMIVTNALRIGSNYNKNKWEIPKVLLHNGQLIVIDGQHRIYGAFTAHIDSVVVEVLECELKEAIMLFINQTQDRRQMRPMDIYHAALEAGVDEYVTLNQICKKNHVVVKGDAITDDTVGVLTSITDGVKLVQMNPKLLDSILKLIGNLKWNGYSNNYKGKAYTAKVIRVMKTMYQYYAGREKEMENILIENCNGTEFFSENVLPKTQAQMFDYLSKIVQTTMENPLKANKKSKLKAI